MSHILGFFTLLSALLGVALATPVRTASQPADPYVVVPGDTWDAISVRSGIPATELRLASGQFNLQREPVIGRTLALPQVENGRTGRLIRPNEGGLLQVAVRNGASPWALARDNQLASPYRPTLLRALLLKDAESIPRDLPAGFQEMSVSHVPARAGEPFGIKAVVASGLEIVTGDIEGLALAIGRHADQLSGMGGTGAFFNNLEPELTIRPEGQAIWRQPLLFVGRDWDYQDLTLTGEAAQIDQASRDAERARLGDLWTVVTPVPQWQNEFRFPIEDYLAISAGYGGRRSYNGGPYQSYHEGVDFSAYSGTPVYAPAGGTVVLAEPLYVRGGTVIIDHGLGVYTGYYHLSVVHAKPGQVVQPGDLLGEVGTTGLSTGNHLHWDMLVNGIWVDPLNWQELGLACWIRDALGLTCGTATDS